MPKLSTFQIILLAVFGSLGVAGVLIFSLITANGNASVIGKVEIWGSLEEAPIQTMLREAADADTRFSEVQYIYVDPVQFDAKLKDALANGTGPDLFIMRQDHAIRDAGYTTPVPYTQLSKTQFTGTFASAAEPFMGKDGVVAVPILVDPLVLFWNKDALATANIPAPPKYWDELPAMAEALSRKTDSGTVERGGIALGYFDNIPAAKDIVTTLIRQAGAKITAYDNSGALRSVLASGANSSLAVTAVNFYTEFANPSRPDYSWSKAFPDALTSFARADVAMYIGYASDAKKIAKTNPNLNFQMASLPQIRSAQYSLNTAAVYGLALTRTSKNQRGAITIAFQIAQDAMTTSLAKTFGMAPALKRALVAQATPSASSEAVAEQQSALQGLIGSSQKSTESLLRYEANISQAWLDPDPDKTSAIFRDMIEGTVSGARKPIEAVQRADKQLGEISITQ